MRDERFAVTEARERLHAEIAVLPVKEQARFWVDCERDVFWFFANNARTRLTDKLEALGVIEKSDDIHRNSTQSSAQVHALLPFAAPMIVDLVEPNASNALERMREEPKTSVDLAVSLLRLLESAARDGQGAQVDDTTVARLEKLMHDLWPEAREKFKRGERLGFCLDYCARVLHRLRPEKYPLHRINARRPAAFNFEDFGLLL